ncbi:MAG: hypothetical protein EOP48_04080 [Sphingobacteriales bacterium]|nr:MAG: hypothetical protein EOP48_04080 [Sphingobacteriales bacterium]
MNYLTGEKIEVGDEVLIEHEKTIGIVFSVIETSQDMQNWGVDEQGVIIKAEPFGLVMWSHKNINDPLIFRNRKT